MRDSIPDLTDAAIEIPDVPRPEPPKPPPPPPSEVDFDQILSRYPPPIRIEPAAAAPRRRWRRSA